MPTPSASVPILRDEDFPARALGAQRERAERLLNVVRAVVLLLLASAALAYAPQIPRPLSIVNVLVLAPTLCWTLAQFALFQRRPVLPGWLMIVNPVVDITAITAILLGYGIAQSATLSLRSPIFLAYFAVLAARPIASSTRRAALAAALVLVEYAAVVGYFLAVGTLTFIANPVAASQSAALSPLDESARLLLLGIAGAIAIYATAWHERLARTYYRESREREQLEIRLAQAQLQSLKLQLRPHFLFNTLNGIAALITTDPPAAERMLSGLSELLRLSLRNAGEQEVPLEREAEILEHFLDIQRVRFQDRLTTEIDIPPDVREALVPNLILQPLVENAIRHGIAPRAAPGRVTVRAWREDGVLHLEVADDGVGRQAARRSSAPGEGIGIANTRARLEHLYGAEHSFRMEDPPRGSGTIVRIALPFRSAAVPA